MSRNRRVGWVAIVFSVGLMGSHGIADETTNAVERGLAWLASHQQPDGSWSTNSALNALPVLAFLSAGKVPGPHDHNVTRGIDFILSKQDGNGAFTSGGGMMYGHGITTLVLAETAGMTVQGGNHRAALQRAVDLILRSQQVEKSPFHRGGWRYYADSADSDLSVTVWQVTALKAASDVGIKVPVSAINEAVEYIRRCEHAQGGFGYQPGGLPNTARTAAASVVLRLCGITGDGMVDRANRWLRDHPLQSREPFFFYGAMHCAHAGVEDARPMLLASQQRDGHWQARPESPPEARAGPLYATSMAVLALTAQYHYLPAYLW